GSDVCSSDLLLASRRRSAFLGCERSRGDDGADQDGGEGEGAERADHRMISRVGGGVHSAPGVAAEAPRAVNHGRDSRQAGPGSGASWRAVVPAGEWGEHASRVLRTRPPPDLFRTGSGRLASGRRGRLVNLSRSEEHTSELQSRENLVCRLLLEKKKEYSTIR